MPERTALYRIFGEADLLLYVGISKDFGSRWEQHARKQPWWGEHRRMTVEWRDSRPEAKAAETAAIKAEKPKYNIAETGKSKNPDGSLRAPWTCGGDPDLEWIEALLLDKSVPVSALRIGCLLALGWDMSEIVKELGIPRRTYYDAMRILMQRDAPASSAESRTNSQVTESEKAA